MICPPHFGWEKYGYDGLFDRRLGKPSPKRVAEETIAEVFRLYREKYAGFSVKHFHEKLVEQHKAFYPSGRDLGRSKIPFFGVSGRSGCFFSRLA